MKTQQELTKEKRKLRKKETAEIFTPKQLVKEMLDMLPTDVWIEDKENTFLDPSCGNGNFLAEILKRKLKLGHDPTIALKTIYGIDIMKDNIQECRDRLWQIVSEYTNITVEHIRITIHNIRWLNLERWPKWLS